jgi:hypothetical protein
MKLFRIEIITKTERNEAISLVREAINAAEGWIITHQLFSNMSASIIFEMPLGGVEGFVANLKNKNFYPQFEGDIPNDKGGGKSDIKGSITLTFIHDEPDMKRDVPPFG